MNDNRIFTNEIEHRVSAVLSNILKKRQERYNIVVGVSGGCDSVCLLHILNKLKEQFQINLHPVHINHMLRGEAADADAVFVSEYCKNMGTPVKLFHFDCKALAEKLNISIEEAGRIKRYRIFNEVLNNLEKENSSGLIAVGHNKDDQAETVLMRIVRGTGIDGLAAMDYLSGNIIRPLLDLSRDEIEKYCELEHLKYRTDESNLTTEYKRNFFRLKLIPYLESELNPNVKDGLVRLSRMAKNDSKYIWEIAQKSYDEAFIEAAHSAEGESQSFVKLRRASVSQAHDAIKSRIILLALEQIGLTANISEKHISSAIQQISSGKTGAVCEFTNFYRMQIGYDELIFERITGEYRKLKNQEKSKLLEKQIAELILLYSTDIANGCEIRTRRAGDYIKINGMTKTIKKYFNEMKIPAEKRDFIPLLCKGDEVLKILND